jgi:hypothetical protein
LKSSRKPAFLLGIAAALSLSAGALLLSPGAALAQPVVIGTYPPNGAERVPANAVLVLIFDRPTAKHAAYSIADLDPSSGGGLITTAPDRWSAAGDTLYITPLNPLPFGHLFGWKLNLLQDADSTFYGNPAYYNEVYYFTTAAQARVERVQAGNLNIALTPDVTRPVSIPVRELAGTDVSFSSARVQFLPSAAIANTDPTPLDTSVSPLYEYTVPISTYLRRRGVVSLVAPVNLPLSVARTIPQGVLGVRLTFYGVDETGSPVVVDAVFRVDPATIVANQASVLPAIASDVLILSATLEWPLHGMVIAAGDTILPRAVVTGNGTGAFRAAFYMDGNLISIEEGYMEAGRPVEIAMRGPLPTRRLGEHRLQFQVEAPQPFAANPISFVCGPPSPGALEPRKPGTIPTTPEEPPPPPPRKLHGAVTWLAEGRTAGQGNDPSAVGWGGWNGAYELSPARRIEAEVSMRVRFDDTGNGNAAPQHMRLRYGTPNSSLEWSDAPPAGAMETPLLMSPVPRRSAQASFRKTPVGDLDAFVALASQPVSAAGAMRHAESDLYAVRLGRSWLGDKIRTFVYGGYTHEDFALPSGFFPLPDTVVQRNIIYGGMARFDLPGNWTFLADGATVRHRAATDSTPDSSRTAWRGELQGSALGFEAILRGFSYQPDLVTALNPYALSDRRGGEARLNRKIWKWNIFGGFRSEEPSRSDGQIPVVRVQTGTLGGRLELNQESWVTASVIRLTHRGAQTDFEESRIATEYSASEPLGGRTTARFDLAFFKDPLRTGAKRRITGGSLVTTRRHPGRVASTLALGVEQNRASDLNLKDTTIQGAFEVRWEAIAGRLLVLPFITGSSREYETLGTKEERYSARLQVALLRVAGFGESAISLEGRVDRQKYLTPSLPDNNDVGVQLTIGRRLGVNAL